MFEPSFLQGHELGVDPLKFDDGQVGLEFWSLISEALSTSPKLIYDLL